MESDQSKGGGYMAKKVWRSFNFIVEVAIESPGAIDEEEAAEDAADFVIMLSHCMARINDSFGSVIRVDECGQRRPKNCPVIWQGGQPSGRRVELTLARGVERREDFYQRPVIKAKKKVISTEVIK